MLDRSYRIARRRARSRERARQLLQRIAELPVMGVAHREDQVRRLGAQAIELLLAAGVAAQHAVELPLIPERPDPLLNQLIERRVAAMGTGVVFLRTGAMVRQESLQMSASGVLLGDNLLQLGAH